MIERIGQIIVVRDDLIPGGTKRRAIDSLLRNGQEFVYASPVYGYAQVALAYACRDLGLRAKIFTAKRLQQHARTTEAEMAGAEIVHVPVGYMTVIRARARAYCERGGAILLPFGLDTLEFITDLARVAADMPIRPKEVWTVAGSGTLSRALQMAWPKADFHAIQVGHVPAIGRAHLHKAPEKFEQDARRPPPFPSCSNFDAKAWAFVTAHARPGALFWNVAA